MKRTTAGWGSGLLGVFIFSGSLPATRMAIADMTPLFVTSARAVVAALLGALFLLTLRQARPSRDALFPLVIVSVGVVVGYPLLSGLALQHISAGHSIVFTGLLPLATAIFGVLRGGERPKPAFWLFSIVGAGIVGGFALYHNSDGSIIGDGLMIAAILLCGLGYAEGAALSRRLGGWQVISWALLLSLPLMAIISLFTMPEQWANVGERAWAGFVYVSIFSMMLGFVFWYRGLALGGIVGVGQLQLLQPFGGFALAALVLGEPIAWTMVASTGLVILCVAGAKRYT